MLLPQRTWLLFKPVAVSSVENSGLPGTNAVDGNAGSRWASAFSDPQWIYVDLQAFYAITRVKLNWEAAYGRAYQIQVSSNAANWTTIYSTTNALGGIEDLTGLSGTGRYVRLYGTARATAYGYSLWELEIYGTAPVTNHPPVLVPIANQTILAGRTLLLTNSASDPDVPPQSLTYTLLSPPSGASIGVTNGLFTWRPTMAQSPSTQTVAVAVSDNGAPPLAATQSFVIAVLQPTAPTLNAASFTNGQFGLWMNGDTGPDYIIQTSSNLGSWISVFTNAPPSLPFLWLDPNAPLVPSRFYRLRLGP